MLSIVDVDLNGNFLDLGVIVVQLQYLKNGEAGSDSFEVSVFSSLPILRLASQLLSLFERWWKSTNYTFRLEQQFPVIQLLVRPFSSQVIISTNFNLPFVSLHLWGSTPSKPLTNNVVFLHTFTTQDSWGMILFLFISLCLIKKK